MPDGRTAMGALGGNVVYATVGAHLWTDDLAMVSRLGRGFPPSLLDQVTAAGLRVDGLVPTSHNGIRQWQLYDVEGGRTYLRLASAGTYEDLAPRASEIPAQMAADLRACHIAPMPIDRQAELVAWAKQRGAHVTLDPHIDWIRGHEDATANHDGPPARATDQRGVAGTIQIACRCTAVSSWPSPVASPDTDRGLLKKNGCGICALTDPVDTTGCGDAFCGGFLAGWCEAGDLRTAILYGTVSASFVGEDFGAAHALVRDQAEARRRLAGLVAKDS